MRPYLLILLMLFPTILFAQKQNNNWCFGFDAGVNFNTSPPTVFSPTISTNESIATVSSRHTGALLFYFDGESIYDANYNVMPNGTSVGFDPGGTCSHGAAIVPFINDTNKYYVFSLGPQGTSGVLAYSVVDMSLNGGMGAVLTNQRQVRIDSNFGETMVIVEGCGEYWLIAGNDIGGGGHFFAYKITVGGIVTTPVISPIKKGPGVGCFKVSPDKKQLAGAAMKWLMMYDFDIVTGAVTRERTLDSVTATTLAGFYSCEFSPDSKKLYATNFNNNELSQYNISLSTIAAVRGSKKVLHSSTTEYIGALQMGPDSNIYVGMSSSPYLGRITNPNGLYPSCVFTKNVIPLPSGSICAIGLPPAVVNVRESPHTRRDTMICVADTFVMKARPGRAWYKWQDGSTNDRFTVKGPGTYWVTMADSCAYVADTLVVTYPEDTLSSYVDSTLCSGDTLILRGRTGMGPYLWDNGSNADSLIVTQPGTYVVTSIGACVPFGDTFSVNYSIDTLTTATDTAICGDGELQLSPLKQHSNATYYWSTGTTSRDIIVRSAGKYWVSASESCTTTIDTISVNKVELSVSAGNDTIACGTDSVLLRGDVYPLGSQVQWSNGSNSLNTYVYNSGQYTLTASYTGCEASDRVFISRYPEIKVDLGSDTEICSGDTYILPRLATIDTGSIYLWQDGSATNKYYVKETGRYTLQVRSKCSNISDTVNISVRDCNLFFPSAFTPNGDGLNDVARFVGDLTNVNDFVLRIYNRRGQEVYATTNVNDGWNGTHNGQPAAMATYYYYIKYIYMGEEHLMKGDIILVR